MKLEEIIKAVRINRTNELLDISFADVKWEDIIVYAEHAISADTEYMLFRATRGRRRIIKRNNLYYEGLCSLLELRDLVAFYLSQHNRKTDDILVIDIIDHFDAD